MKRRPRDEKRKRPIKPVRRPKQTPALILFALTLSLFCSHASAQERRATVAVLDPGSTQTGRRVADLVARRLVEASGPSQVAVLDRELARAAARGAGYEGSLNMTLREARDLGAAIGCDFIITGDAQVIRRSSSARPVYFEAYASLFIISTRTGRLVGWSRPAVEADAPEQAEAALFALLESEETIRLLSSINAARETEEREKITRARRERSGEGEDDDSVAMLDLTSGAEIEGLREPAPYSRVRPTYTDAASRAEAEATVDVIAEIGTDGRVGSVEVVRWAGFGLDEEVVATVRRMNFRPAMIAGRPHPSRVLLRYNFRKPQKAEK